MKEKHCFVLFGLLCSQQMKNVREMNRKFLVFLQEKIQPHQGPDTTDIVFENNRIKKNYQKFQNKVILENNRFLRKIQTMVVIKKTSPENRFYPIFVKVGHLIQEMSDLSSGEFKYPLRKRIERLRWMDSICEEIKGNLEELLFQENTKAVS